MARHDRIQADDGTFLDLKEGVVIDRDGNELASSYTGRTEDRARSTVFVWRAHPVLAPLLIAPLLVVMVTVGLTLFAGVAVAAFVGWILFALFQSLRRL